MRLHHTLPLAAAITFAGVVGCSKSGSEEKVAPAASTLQPAEKKAASAMKADVVAKDSNVTFAMESVLEKIYGYAPGSMEGELFVDVADLSKTSGLVKVDLLKLEIKQKKAEKPGGEFGEEEKKPKQNEHMRQWFEINEGHPNRDKNRYVQFKITKVMSKTTDVTKLAGDERKVDVEVEGEFLLHGHKAMKKVPMEATFKFADGKASSVHMKTKQPFAVSLPEHKIGPHDTTGQLLQWFSEQVPDPHNLRKKVHKEALVSLEFSANLKAK